MVATNAAIAVEPKDAQLSSHFNRRIQTQCTQKKNQIYLNNNKR